MRWGEPQGAAWVAVAGGLAINLFLWTVHFLGYV